MSVFLWSRTASSNGTADPTAPFPPGMAASAVSPGIRGAMAAVAQYRDDIAGAIVTTGTNTAYLVSSYSFFDTLAHLNGQMIAFTPHATNGATVTLSVDSLGAKPLRTSPGVELLAGTIIQGTPYVATYSNSDGAFYLHNFYGASPYLIPLAAGIDFWGTTAPNSSFAFPAGQAISRSTYATLFAIMGTTFGVGDGSTTFNLPDKRGRVTASADNMGGSSAGNISLSFAGTGGAATETLAMGNLPASPAPVSAATSGYTPSVAGGGTPILPAFGVSVQSNYTPTGAGTVFPAVYFTTLNGFSSLTVGSNTANLGSGTAFSLLQPTIACNYILRII